MNKIIHEISFDNRTRHDIDFDHEMKEIVKNFAKFFKINKQILLDVKVVSKRKIKLLNKEYRNKDYVTDILSFGHYDRSLYDQLPFVLLGELIICYDRMVEQAIEFNHSIKREFCYLFTHGLVHLAGYDHEVEEERIKMNKIVDKIFKPLKIGRE
ncbi:MULTISPECIES: rRNA maturation RNase YbeY [unclassified Mycoplasma]|uniref:rRNA maturation RNase YbeY n=1 Tax=unclassified Mycoplasma TaxID=2683645 RepID=UPI00211C3DA4|nr:MULTISPECIES: rRNA maturation RNase YbeY [unclassified Mycoplasma]UUM19983.1 rRNA maturation RNase YbeY [Mycoplasma sp. 1578d]UUM24964.1 rRNA maturation RNase YbeY [Mycoplasma sp. 3686d]